MPRKPLQKKEKPITAERPQSIVLTEAQAVYVDSRMGGKAPDVAAREAGYASASANAMRVEKSVAVQEALRAARDELSSAAQIKRADVIDGIMEGINMARLGADPATMIKGWTEIGKILGHYAPEVKKVEISGKQKRLQSKYEAMTDEQLAQIIDGECRDITEEEE